MDLQTIEVRGERFVLVPEPQFRRIKPMLDSLPAMPEADEKGRVDALAFGRTSLATDLILARRRAGLTQQQLARKAGVRQETISRLESGKHRIRPATYERLWSHLK